VQVLLKSCWCVGIRRTQFRAMRVAISLGFRSEQQFLDSQKLMTFFSTCIARCALEASLGCCTSKRGLRYVRSIRVRTWVMISNGESLHPSLHPCQSPLNNVATKLWYTLHPFASMLFMIPFLSPVFYVWAYRNSSHLILARWIP
jgi:hypothetical protein